MRNRVECDGDIFMKHVSKTLALTLTVCAFFVSAGGFAASNISSIVYKNKSDRGLLTIGYNGKGQLKTSSANDGKLIIIEADGFDIPAKLTKSIDASYLDGATIQITPYKSESKNKVKTKIVVSLKFPAKTLFSESPGKFVLEIFGKNSLSRVDTKKQSPKLNDQVKSIQSAPEKTPTISKADMDENTKIWSEQDASVKKNIESKTEITKKLVDVLNSSEEPKKYFGAPIDFTSEGANIYNVFALVGQLTGLNIVADSDVSGTVSVDVAQVPWDQLLDIALSQTRLKAVASGNVIRILRQDTYLKEQEDKIKQLVVIDQSEPVIMAVIPLSFTTGADIKKMIDSLLVSKAPATAPTATTTASGAVTTNFQAFAKGKIEIDERSNSIVITNTRDAIERIRKLIKELDVALPQVLIDAKIVIAQEKFSKTLGVTYGGKLQSTSGRAGAGIGMLGSETSIGADASTAGSFAISSPKDGLGFGLQLGSGPNANLNAKLSLAESNGVSKTVASPRVIVNNKVAATISDGQKIYVTKTETVAGTTTTTTQTISADLSMTVTPQVTSSGSVLLKVNVNKSAPSVFNGNVSTDTKSLNTEVLVDSGNTLVLGGVYQFADTRAVSGIPVLKDLPFIGQLFRTNSDSTVKDELMVFITPQIMEPTGGGPLVHETEEKTTL